MPTRDPRRDTIDGLREQLRRLERSYRPVGAAHPTGTPLDRLLPEGGIAGGTLLEWLGDGEGSGAATLALAAAVPLLNSGALVVIDPHAEFYPPGAAGLGVPLERTVAVRPGGAADALWALEQALRSGAAGVALARVGALGDRAFRRLQLAAEAGGGVGFLVRPAACRVEPSFAAARLLVMPRASERSWVRRLRVEVLHCRGGAAGGAVELEVNHEAGAVRMAAPVARPALPPRAAGA